MKAGKIVLLVLVIIAFQFSLTFAYGFSGAVISDPLLSKPVTIDGNWTSSDEWSDAAKVSLSSTCSTCAGNAFLYAKHDASSFYFLIDFISAVTLGPNDHASVTIDPAHVSGDFAQSDDVRFDSAYPNGGTMAVGTGGSDLSWGHPLPSGVLIAFSMSGSPNSATPHEISEFEIPFAIFPGMQNTIGFAAATFQDNTKLVIWPANYYLVIPRTWGELTLSPTPVPEFDNLWLIVLLSIAPILVLIRGQRSRRRQYASHK